jgi:CRISPR-associated protein Cmr1
MRFWWRAVQAEQHIERLRDRENAIFGSSSEKIGASRFSLRISKPDKNPISEFRNPGRDDPIGYMFYSAFIQRERKRPFFPEGTRFTITLSSRNEDVLRTAAASLWLLLCLGGLGMRTRRGAGNVRALKVDDPMGILKGTGLEFTPGADKSEDVANWILRNFQVVKKMISEDRDGFVTAYTNLVFSRFVISKDSYSSWKDALAATGFMSFRKKNKHRVLETPVFGFPVMHRNRRIFKGKTGRQWINRRSSPIIFRVIQSNDRFFWMVIRLSGEFLPEGGVITDGKKSGKPDYKIIDEFWNTLKEKGREYILSIPLTLNETVGTIVRTINTQKVILFGSRARGDAHERSDIDIAVETTGSISDLNLRGNIDIVDLKHADKSLKHVIKREGVVLYERES